MLPGKYSWFAVAPTTLRVPASVQAFFTAVNCVVALVTGMRILVATRRRVILSVLDGGASTLAGFVASVIGRSPQVLLVFDPWEENAYPSPDRRLASLAEGAVMRRAAAVVVFSEELARHYRAKHGVSPQVLRIPIVAPSRRVAAPRPAGRPRAQVLAAGSLYWAQREAMERVADACARIDDSEFVVMGNSVERLDGATMEPPVAEDAYRDRLAQADLLVLGLSFGTRYPLVVETATPARFPESLASGTPLLVHAPHHSYVARVTRETGAGFVVDTPDVDQLEAAIRFLLADREAAREMSRRARQLARKFDIDHVARELRGILRRR